MCSESAFHVLGPPVFDTWKRCRNTPTRKRLRKCHDSDAGHFRSGLCDLGVRDLEASLRTESALLRSSVVGGLQIGGVDGDEKSGGGLGDEGECGEEGDSGEEWGMGYEGDVSAGVGVGVGVGKQLDDIVSLQKVVRDLREEADITRASMMQREARGSLGRMWLENNDDDDDDDDDDGDGGGDGEVVRRAGGEFARAVEEEGDDDVCELESGGEEEGRSMGSVGGGGKEGGGVATVGNDVEEVQQHKRDGVQSRAGQGAQRQRGEGAQKLDGEGVHLKGGEGAQPRSEGVLSDAGEETSTAPHGPRKGGARLRMLPLPSPIR